MIAACVLHLFAMCCPSAVAGLIVATSVDAVDAVAFRLWSHIAEERLERLSPSTANDDASCTVVFIAKVIRNTASPNHSAPNPILRSGSPAIAMPMRAARVTNRHTANASAIRCVAAFQVITSRLKNCPAFAAAPPKTADLLRSAVFSSKAKNGHHAEYLVGNIDKTRPGWKWLKNRRLSIHTAILSCNAMTSRDKR
jgi:hypothetical protein